MADRVRDHRPELVGEQVLLVLGQGEGGGGQRGEEEAVLLAGGAVQLHPPVGLAQALDALLELGFVAAGDGEQQRRAQQRRAVAAAQDGLQLAGEMGALGRLDRGAVLALGLLAGDLVGVDLCAWRPGARASRLATNSTERVASTAKPSSSGVNISSAAGPGHDRLLRHRAEHQLAPGGRGRARSRPAASAARR